MEKEPTLGERYLEKWREFKEVDEPKGETIQELLEAAKSKLREGKILEELCGLVEEANRPYVEAYTQWEQEGEELNRQRQEAEEIVAELGQDSTGVLGAIERAAEEHQKRGETDPNIQMGSEIVVAKQAYLARLQTEEERREQERLMKEQEKAKAQERETRKEWATKIIERAGAVQHFGPPRRGEKFSFGQIIQEAIGHRFLIEVS